MTLPSRIGVRTVNPGLVVTQVIMAVILVSAICSGQNQATLYVINNGLGGWSCVPGKASILDDDTSIVQLDHKHYVVLHVAPGHHVFQLNLPKLYWQAHRSLRGDFLPGETYYLVVATSGCFSTFKMVPKDEAEKLIAKIKVQPATK